MIWRFPSALNHNGSRIYIAEDGDVYFLNPIRDREEFVTRDTRAPATDNDTNAKQRRLKA